MYKQREIRLASESVGTAIVTCDHRARRPTTVANGSTIPSDARHRRAWVSGETVIGAHDTHRQLFSSYFFYTSYPLNTYYCAIKPILRRLNCARGAAVVYAIAFPAARQIIASLSYCRLFRYVDRTRVLCTYVQRNLH